MKKGGSILNMKKRKILIAIILFLAISGISQNNLYAKNKQTIYIIGDSIAQSYEGNKVRNGWGQILYQYFKSPTKIKKSHLKSASDYVDVIRYMNSDVLIENWGKSGASVKIYDKYGMFQSIQRKLKKGDYVLIQLGHNEIYTQWWTGSTVSEYKTYLIDYVKQIRAKGASPILITPPPVNTTGKYTPHVPQYRNAMISIGNEYKIPVLDLGQRTAEYFNLIGKKEANKMYVKDNMHFTPEGAKTLAKILSVEIEHKRQLKPIASKVRLKTNTLYTTINKVSKLKSKKYSKKSWNAIQKQLKNSKKILYSNSATQKAIDQSNIKLKKVIKHKK